MYVPQPAIAAVGRMLSNERTNQQTNRPTNKHINQQNDG